MYAYMLYSTYSMYVYERFLFLCFYQYSGKYPLAINSRAKTADKNHNQL